MPGKIDLIQILVIAGSAIAFLTDVIRGKIYNWLTVPLTCFGLVYSSYQNGWHGFLDSIAGLGLGFGLYGWMYVLGWMGGGDVKLLMALGALCGWQFTIEVAVLGILIGGVMAVVSLLLHGVLLSFIKRIYYFFLALFIKELQPFMPKIDQKLTMPFGIAIGLAAVWNLFFHPLGIWSL